MNEIPLAEGDEVIEALLLNRLHEPLDEGIGVGRANGILQFVTRQLFNVRQNERLNLPSQSHRTA